MPIAQLIERTLREIASDAREIGCDRELEGISRILRDGNGAERQLSRLRGNGRRARGRA